MRKKKIINYCLVGYGSHAEKKIIPAILKSYNKLWGIVTRRKLNQSCSANVFRLLKNALKECPKDTLFIVCNEPKNHFRDAEKIISHGFNVLIEKPMFLNSREFLEISKRNKKNFFNECFMYKFTNMYKKMRSQINVLGDLKKIDIVFTIPELPPKSFRVSKQISASLIYDIGCYAFSFINENNIKINKIDLIKVFNKGNEHKELFVIKGDGAIKKKKLTLNIKFGLKKRYENQVSIFTEHNEKYVYKPFFYGRNTKKTINIYKRNKLVTKDIFDDEDAFFVMYNRNISEWKNEFDKNRKIALSNILMIEKIINQYKLI